MKTYKFGDIYPDWKKLSRLPENKTAKELGLKEGELFVYVGNDRTFENGEIIKLIRDDESNYILFKGKTKYAHMYLFELAKLPKEKPRPTMEIVQDKIVKFSDSETQYGKRLINFMFNEHQIMDKPEELEKLLKQLRRELARHKNIKF